MSDRERFYRSWSQEALARSERGHREDVQRAAEMGRQQAARLLSHGFVNSREYSKEMKRRAIRGRFVPWYASLLTDHQGL